MVRLVTYSDGKYGERGDECRSQHCLLSEWRPNKLILVPSVDSDLLMKSDDSTVDRASVFSRNRIKPLNYCTSENSLKAVHRTISEYWRDVLRYHWPIAVQSLFLVIVIITMGPWVGLTCNEEISEAEERSVTWRFPILSELKSALDYTYSDIPEPSCTHGFCCFSKNIEGTSTRRRPSFLKRKRITKAFDTF